EVPSYCPSFLRYIPQFSQQLLIVLPGPHADPVIPPVQPRVIGAGADENLPPQKVLLPPLPPPEKEVVGLGVPDLKSQLPQAVLQEIPLPADHMPGLFHILRLL